VALWHERDISHSSAERVIFPDSTILLDYMLNKTADLIDRLMVYPERMLRNINASGGLVFSGQLLLDLVEAGLTREDAYRLVQKNAMKAWKGRPGVPRPDRKRAGDREAGLPQADGNGVRPQAPVEKCRRDLCAGVREEVGVLVAPAASLSEVQRSRRPGNYPCRNAACGVFLYRYEPNRSTKFSSRWWPNSPPVLHA
jgi:Adenylosuccinate lyase